MSSYIDHHSDLVQSIPYPVYQGPGLRIDAWGAAVPTKKKQVPVSSGLQVTKDEALLFEDSLILSGRKSRPRNVWAAVGSLTLQSLLLAAVVIIPLYHTEILPKRETLTMLYAPPPPPPPAASSARKLSTPMPASTYKPTSISLPNRERQTQEAPATSAGTVGGVIGGVPGGVIGGVPGGVLGEVLGNTGSAPVLAKAPDPSPVKRVRLAARVVEANLVHDVTPAYPPEAGRARIEGTVVLWAVIGKDGSVQEVRVESGLPILAQAAIDAVKQWRYKPYLLNGEPVEVDSRITINFALSS